jgi:hypothetical protein
MNVRACCMHLSQIFCICAQTGGGRECGPVEIGSGDNPSFQSFGTIRDFRKHSNS